jgi:imidazolonepropionase-like amidohydrolase
MAELKAAIYPPNPTYDISEKPWLPGPQKAYLLLNAKLVDPRAGVVHNNMTLQLAGGKIVRVSPTTAQDLAADFYCAGQKVEKIDASKYFVSPGLIDCKSPPRSSRDPH